MKGAPVIIFGVVSVLGIAWILTRPAPPTPEQKSAMAAAEQYMRAKGYWQNGTRLTARAYTPMKFAATGDPKIDYWIHTVWFVHADHPGDYVGGHSTYYLDKNFRVIHFSGGK